MSWLVELFSAGNGMFDFLMDSDANEIIKGLAKTIEESADGIKNTIKDAKEADSGGFLGVPLFENDFWKLAFKFGMNFSVILIIVRAIYYPIAKRKDYLFTYIMISLVIALSNKKMSYAELAFTNAAIIGVTYGLERIWLLKHESRKVIVFEKIDLITPEKHDELLADLEKRTGLTITRLEIGKINFLNDTAQVFIFYNEDEQKGHFRDEGISNT